MPKTYLPRCGSLLLAGLLLSVTASAQNNHIVEVAQNGLTFTPADLHINMGDTITWNWNGGMAHNVNADLGAFFSGPPTVAPNTFSVTFDGAFLAANPVANDLYTYHCDPHQLFGMVGSVHVMSPRVLSVSNFIAGQTGVLRFQGANPGAVVILGYSTAGNGPFAVAMGTLSLSPPFQQLPPLHADASGNASLSVNLPAGLAGMTAFLHAAEMLGGGAGILSNPLTVTL